MKKLLFTIIGAIIVISLIACSSYEDFPINIKEATGVIIEEVEVNTKELHQSYSSITSGDIQDWQKAYIKFLSEFVILDGFDSCTYALRDINLDGVPELIIDQSDKSSVSLLEIFSFKDGVYKTGEYIDSKVGSALRISDNPLYPGLFNLRWGGGVERYGYITVEDGLLVYEYLWFNNLAPEEVAKENGQPGKNMISDNKELIELSAKVFTNVNDNNMLEMFILGDNDFHPIS